MGGLGTIITIIIIVAWIVRGLSAVVGNDQEQGKKPQPRPLESEDWDEMQEQRRAELAEEQRSVPEMRADAGNPAEMTMAERIELARQRARQQSGGGSQQEAQAEALRRSRERVEQQTQQERRAAQQRQRAQRERAVQEQAARERQRRQQAQRRRAAEEQAEIEQQRRRRSRSSRPKQPKPAPAATGSRRERAAASAMARSGQGIAGGGPTLTKIGPPETTANAPADALGPIDRKSLRKAFIMKELLDKPVALRDPQADLPS